MKSLRDVFARNLVELGKENSKIVVLDCDMARHTKMSMFSEMFPDRFYQMGIAEQNAIGIAAGMAKGGKVPIVSSFAVFICGRAWEQIRHSIVYNEANVKIFATHGGLAAAEDGGSHQCFEDIALMLALPGIEIFAPAFPNECMRICKYIVSSGKPAYIRVGRSDVYYDTDKKYEIGNEIIAGDMESDIAVVSTGEITQEVYKVLEVNKCFKSIHIGQLRPLNVEKIKMQLVHSSKVIVIEEGSKYGGLSSILFINGLLKCKEVICMNMDEHLGQTGTEEELRNYYGLSAEHILAQVRRIR